MPEKYFEITYKMPSTSNFFNQLAINSNFLIKYFMNEMLKISFMLIWKGNNIVSLFPKNVGECFYIP